jgi:hypothetical protein
VTGRSTRDQPSEYGRPETIEEQQSWSRPDRDARGFDVLGQQRLIEEVVGPAEEGLWPAPA